MRLFEAKHILKKNGYIVESMGKSGLIIVDADDDSFFDNFPFYDGVIGDYDEFFADKFEEDPDLEDKLASFQDKIIKEVKRCGKTICNSDTGCILKVNKNLGIQFSVVYDKSTGRLLACGIADGETAEGELYSEFMPRVIGKLTDIKKIVDYFKTL